MAGKKWKLLQQVFMCGPVSQQSTGLVGGDQIGLWWMALGYGFLFLSAELY